MKEHVWIFGDSFAEIWRGGHLETTPAWPRMIEKDFYVENFAKSGSGPDYQLDILYKKINHAKFNIHQLKDISLIFLLSHGSRIDFSFLEQPQDQVNVINVILSRKERKKLGSLTEEVYEKYKSYSAFITDFYNFYYFHQNHELDFYKRVSLLKDIAPLFKKVLVVPVFDDIEEHTLYQLTQQFNLISNFHIAQGEGLGRFHTSDPLAPNHFIPENHVEFYNMLKRWIDKGINIRTKKLKKS